MRPPLRCEAYDVLLGAIIRGDLAPGEQIRDSELAASIGLSRTPMREAIGLLAEAGLVESKPGVYTRITVPTRQNVVATVEVLRALDEIALRAAAPVLTVAHLDRLAAANRQFADAVAATDVLKIFASDEAFHGVFVEAAGNPVVARLLPQLYPQVHRVLYRRFSTVHGGRDSIGYHDELLRLCQAGDVEAVTRLSAAHWSRLVDLIGGLFDTGQV
jgi:DNA-binding GntR family transcriptional regulator